MDTTAVILSGPKELTLGTVPLDVPQDGDVVVDIRFSGISTGTEKLLWTGDMPPFPGMGYPLVPGYEASGEVIEADAASGLSPGDIVFVPGAACFGPVRGVFGGAAKRLVTRGDRVVKVDPALGPKGALLALAATAYHAMAGAMTEPPDLIIGHGVLGRLLARHVLAAGLPAPRVWEIDSQRRAGADGYDVMHPDADDRRDYRCICDATGDPRILDRAIGHLRKGGEIVLAGFYSTPVTFAFPPAFMKEVRIRVSAEWTPDDLAATRALVESGTLSLDGLITHLVPAADAESAYKTAFSDSNCLKMILDWRSLA